MAKVILEMETGDPVLATVLTALLGGASATPVKKMAPAAGGGGDSNTSAKDDTPDVETIKKEVSAAAKAGKREEIKTILAKFDDATSVSTLDPKHYPAFYKEFKALK